MFLISRFRPHAPGGSAHRIIASVALLIAASNHSHAAVTDRWYSPQQISGGRALFQTYCASCHGSEAQGTTPDWKQPDPDGKFPPPPLNGSAHAWHHPLQILRRTIRTGGAPVGGVMPAFGGVLEAEQIDAVIAGFQSRWSDEVYAAWAQRNGTLAPPSKPPPSTAPPPAQPVARDETRRLRRLLGGRPVGDPQPTPIDGVFAVQVGGERLYLLDGGRYAMTGDLIDLDSGTNLTESARSAERKALVDRFPETQRIIYPAEGQERAQLRVLTDTTCPFCRKLHAEVPKLQRAGISVHYIAFPRGGETSEGARQMRSVWCANNRREAMDVAKGTAPGELGAGDCPEADAVMAGYRLGQQIGVTGTPTLVLEDGRMVSGYRPAVELIRVLGL